MADGMAFNPYYYVWMGNGNDCDGGDSGDERGRRVPTLGVDLMVAFVNEAVFFWDMIEPLLV